MCVPDICRGDNCIREEHRIVLNVWASEVKKPCSTCKKECIVYMYMWEKLVEELTHRQPHRVQLQPVLMPSPSLALSSHLPPSLSRSALSECYHNNTWHTCTSLAPGSLARIAGRGVKRESPVHIVCTCANYLGYPFTCNCQNVVKQQQSNNSSNFEGCSSYITHQMHTFGSY